MPAANQAGLGCELRMRSTGLSQLAGGAGTSTSSIRKSPFGASGTPAPFVLCSIKGATASQISVAKTLALALKPIWSPPQQQAFAVGVDAPVGLHVCRESGDHPDLAGGLNPADDVPVHDLGGGRQPHGAGDGQDPDSP